MKTLDHSSGVRYAVIQIRQSDCGTEHFVIQYHDERALRQFLAKPSIIATGFSSRDEAARESFMAGTRSRRTLQGLGRVLKVMNKIIHIAGAALHTSQSRLTCEQQRLEPAVQQQ